MHTAMYITLGTGIMEDTMDDNMMQVIKQKNYKISSVEEENRGRSILLAVKDNVKKVKDLIKSIKDRHKAELEKHKGDLEKLEMIESKIKQALIDRHNELERVRIELQKKEMEKYERRVDRAEKKGEATYFVKPPIIIPPDAKHKEDSERGTTTITVRYRYSIPGVEDGQDLRMHQEAAKLIPPRYFVLSPPSIHADDPWPEKAPATWWVLDRAMVRRVVDGSMGEQVIPGIIIEKYESMSVKNTVTQYNGGQ